MCPLQQVATSSAVGQLCGASILPAVLGRWHVQDLGTVSFPLLSSISLSPYPLSSRKIDQILAPLPIRPRPPLSFLDYWASHATLGGQKNVPQVAVAAQCCSLFLLRDSIQAALQELGCGPITWPFITILLTYLFPDPRACAVYSMQQ